MSLPNDLKDFIKNIGQTRSKQQQDRLVNQQLSHIKSKFLTKGLTSKKTKQLLFMVIFVEMLGFQADFAYIHAVNLTQSKALKQKRLGYLACTLFLTHSPQFLIMLVRTMQKDLQSSSIHQIIMGLTTLHKLMNQTLAQAMSQHVYKLLNHPTDLVRKKAILVVDAIKNVSKNFNLPNYNDIMNKALCDKQPSVMFGALNMYHRQAKQDPIKLKDITGHLIIILKQIIDHKLHKDYEFHLCPSPWMQIKIMKILALLGKNNLHASQQIYQVLIMALNRSLDSISNISLAITYQAVSTATSIYPDQRVLQISARSISRFLNHQKNTFKVLGIKLLSKMAICFPSVIQQHQLAVVQCLEVKDDTMKRITLELLIKICSPDNVNIIFQKMLKTLKSSNDEFFKKDLVKNIFKICQDCAPSQQWFIQNVVQLFALQQGLIQQQQLTSYLSLIFQAFSDNQSGLSKFVLQAVGQLSRQPHNQSIKVISWVYGQIGSAQYNNNQQQLNKLLQTLLNIGMCQHVSNRANIWILDALSKLSTCQGFDPNFPNLKQYIDKLFKSPVHLISFRTSQIKNLSKFNSFLRLSGNLSFDQEMPFLNSYINAATKQGAKPYKKITQAIQQTNNLVFTPYPTKQISYSKADPTKPVWIPESQIAKEQEKKQQLIPIEIPKQKKQVKMQFKGPKTVQKQKQDPKLKNKQLLSNALVSGLKGQHTFKGPQKKKVPNKVQNNQLL